MSNEQKRTTVNGGVGFSGLLTIVFITLKLCRIIDWKWLWVLSPLWIGVIVNVVLIIISFILFILICIIDHIK